MKNKLRAGFTLIEMLVVICIILILAALLAVLIKHVIDRARHGKTQGIIQAMTQGCETYKMEFGGYPSSSVPYAGSRNLHHCLGRDYVHVAGKGQSMQTVSKRDPIVVFKSDWLQGSPANPYPNPAAFLVDAWDNVIQYANPHPTNPQMGFRVWADCKLLGDPADDQANDIRE